MPRYLLALIALILVAAACGDDDSPQPEEQSATPLPTLDAEHATWSSIYMQLGEAQEFVKNLGVEGTTLTAANYECFQTGCPEEAPGDESYGCLGILPTGDPAHVESHYPADPPAWYSLSWEGSFRETYGARPEPVVNNVKSTIEPRQDLACGAESQHYLSAADAASFLANADLLGIWLAQGLGVADPGCATSDCPIPGIPADANGCLSIQIYEQPHYAAGQTDASVDVFVNWQSKGTETSGSRDYYVPSFSVRRFLKDVVASVDVGTDDRCRPEYEPRPHDPYQWVPYTDVIQPMEWRLTEVPSGSTLELLVAIGGGCEKFERVDVDETAESVTITALIRHSNGGAYDGCTGELNTRPYTVELNEPLGDRPLYGCDPIPTVSFLGDNVPADADCTDALTVGRRHEP